MKKILVAEDDTFLAKALSLKLQKLGYEVTVAPDGAEALTCLRNAPPDLLILDLIMPVKDGFEVLEELKKSSPGKSVPVIVASNLGQKEDITRALSLGAQDYLVKSDMSLEELGNKIGHLLHVS